MNCQQFRKYVSAFADGELDVEHNLEALEHLNMCQVCAARVADIQQLKAALVRVTPQEPAPQRLRDRILGALSAEGGADVEIHMGDDESGDTIVLRPTARRRAGYLVPVAMAAAVLFAVTLWRIVPLMMVGKGAMSAVQVQTVAAVRDQHRRCAAHRERPHHDPTLGSTPSEAASLLSDRLGMPVLAPDLTEFECEFVGADQCGIKGRAGAHILYKCSGPDSMLSLFTVEQLPELDTAGYSARERPFFLMCAEGMRVVAWRDGRATYVGCGSEQLSQALLLDVAEAARKTDIQR